MKVGDLVLYQTQRWKVTKHDRRLRVCTLMNWERETIEVADDDPTVVWACHPPTEWPFVAAPTKGIKAGPLIVIQRAGEILRPLVAWVPSEFMRPGGSIFFSPRLQLREREVLVGTHQSGVLSRINITRAFGTVKRRIQRTKVKPVEPQSAFERLMGPDLYEDE